MGNFLHVFDELYKQLDKIDRAIKDAADVTIVEYSNKQKGILEDFGKTAVDNFYNAYDPDYYTKDFKKGILGYRQYDLAQAIDITIDNNSPKNQVHFGFDPSRLDEHKGKGDKKNIIFELAFYNGYHGGKYYRKPLFKWTNISREAVQSTPIIDDIQSMIDAYDFQSMIDKMYEKNLNKLL